MIEKNGKIRRQIGIQIIVHYGPLKKLRGRKKQFLHNKINQDGTVHFDRKKIEYTKKQ